MITANASPLLARAEQAEARLEMITQYINECMTDLKKKKKAHEARLAQGKSCGCSPTGCTYCGYKHNCLHHGPRQIYADILCMVEGYAPGNFGNRD